MISEKLLPPDLLGRASLRGNEYAWPLRDIPDVIAAASRSNLVNIGGQLQFRFPDGGTCECYWVQVDTCKIVPNNLPWAERVARTAEAGLADFHALQSRYDFLAEGRTGFKDVFRKREAAGDDPAAAMCFVWYVATQADER